MKKEEKIKALAEKAAIYIEELGISGDKMVNVKTEMGKGAMYLHDIIAHFCVNIMRNKNEQ